MEASLEFNARDRAEMSQFLDEHLGEIETNDVGALIGQIAQLCERPLLDAAAWRSISDAISRALAP